MILHYSTIDALNNILIHWLFYVARKALNKLIYTNNACHLREIYLLTTHATEHKEPVVR